MLTCDLTYALNRGSVTYTYGEDGLDSFEDTETILKATGTGETEPEAVRNAIAALPTTLRDKLVALAEELEDCTGWSDDLEYVKRYIRDTVIEVKAVKHATTTFHNPNWEWDEVSWVSPVATVPMGHTRWEVFTYDDEDDDAVDYDEPNTTTHNLLTGGLNA